jgi:phytoene desaturase
VSRIVVVGAGVGGLAAAVRLAHAGHDVAICEAQETVGGKLGLYERDGFRFDTGPSLVTMPQVLRELFEQTGGWPRDLVLRELEPIARYRFADGTTFDATSDLDDFRRRLDAALGPGNGDDWRRFLTHARRIWDATRVPFLESPLDGPRTMARLALRQPRDVVTIGPGRSLRQLGRRYLRDPRLRMFLDRYATYTGSDPRRAPAVLAVVPFVEQEYGGWYVEGGLRRIADALRERALDRGATLVVGARVSRIETSSGRVDGVLLADGGRLRADVVVANVDASTVYGSMVSCLPAARRLARATPSLSGFVLLLAVEGRTPGLAHHNVLFPSDYDAEFDAVFGSPARPVPDPTLYVSAPDDSAVRPEGTEAWFVLVNAPRHGSGPGAVDWTEGGVASSYAEHLLDLLDRRGLAVRDRVRWREVLSPADLEQRTGAVGGAIYGTSSNGAAAAFLRPANRSPIPGLFLVGGSSHPGGGLPLVTLSARIVANLVGPA